MYIIPGVPEGTEFKPRVRKEIGVGHVVRDRDGLISVAISMMMFCTEIHYIQLSRASVDGVVRCHTSATFLAHL